MDPSPSNSTYNLEGVPEPANTSVGGSLVDTSHDLALGPLSIEPLNSIPAMESGPSSVGDNVASAEPVVPSRVPQSLFNILE